MKRFKLLSCLLAVALSLGTVVSSTAATLPQNFAASDGKVFQINTALSVEKGAGVIYVKHYSGTVMPFADATGTLWTKVLNSPNFSQYFIKIPNTDRYMNTTLSSEISCISSQTVFAYPFSTQAEWFQDNCALHTVVKNASN